MNFVRKAFNNRWLFIFASLVCAPILAGWIGDTIYNYSTATKWQWCLTTIAILSLFGLACWAWHIQKKWLAYDIQPHNLDAIDCKALCLWVSTPNDYEISIDGTNWFLFIKGDRLTLPINEGFGAIYSVLQNHRLNLTMPLIAIEQAIKHSANPSDLTVHLIPSPDSEPHAKNLSALLRAMQIRVTLNPAISFDNIDACQQVIEKTMKDWQKQGIKEEQMVLDITSGTKPATLAMAMVTFQNKANIQYVDGNKVVQVFNVTAKIRD